MASLAEREGLRGKVQCIYFDPPYGIKFNSNFQWSTTTRDVKDGKAEHITREPEQVKAFRDTWRDGIHSYLTYLRDRLTVARDLLTESGSIFVQIGDENVHRVRSLMDEVFGDENFVSLISFRTTTGKASSILDSTRDFIIWFAKSKENIKYRKLWFYRDYDKDLNYRHDFDEYGVFKNSDGNPYRLARMNPITSQSGSNTTMFEYSFQNRGFRPGKGGWKTNLKGMNRLNKASRLTFSGKTLGFIRPAVDFPCQAFNDIWDDTRQSGFGDEKKYVVQTATTVIQRCITLTTDPGDLVLDPTCGSGTTAYVAEQWGRRWITIDTSRVSLALARARLMGAKYDYYLLADSEEGQEKEAELQRRPPSMKPTYGDIRQGFVYERVPHIMLRDIANNAEIDVIWDQFQEKMEPVRAQLNTELGKSWEEWEIPREAGEPWPEPAQDVHADIKAELEKGIEASKVRLSNLLTKLTEALGRTLSLEELPEKPRDPWPDKANQLHAKWWKLRIKRQNEMDASIAANAEQEYLYDRPYTDKNKVRVAGPFTVESLSPHRTAALDENDEIIDRKTAAPGNGYRKTRDFGELIIDNLREAGIQQAHKEDRITFESLEPWPGKNIAAEGFYYEGETRRRAGILIGPEFGTVMRADLVDAAREAADVGFDVIISCAFSYEAHAADVNKIGIIPVLKANMNADLHTADDLTGKGNLFVIFGEPDVDVASEEWLVDRHHQKLAPYEIFKIISGTDRLEEINRLKHSDLQAYLKLSNRREIWDYITNAAGRHLDTRKHSGGSGKADNGGISAVAWDSAGISGRAGNLSDYLGALTTGDRDGLQQLVARLRGNKQNAKRSDEGANQALNASHLPLTNTHYYQVRINGVDVFHPQTGEIRSDNADGIACWFLDTDYNEESFFVRHAYFLGAGVNDPYKSLKTTLKNEINKQAWETLNSDTSVPFEKPASGRIAVKVINHLGDEVMKVFRV
ncbi:site-specific DNA-methyltransferase [Cyclonatronum proteinivorum]